MRHILPLLLSSLAKRETPQEHSHDRYIIQVKQMLDLNNTLGVSDPTYGLLVNSMAATGMGSVTDPNCLQLEIADIAYTNAKSNNNLEGLVASLIYRALERNTAAVGVASESCTSYSPRNPELATFKQHQDPASPGAQANNKAVVLELARQIALVGGDPTVALDSGTFKPGDLSSNDPAGNGCNSSDCIYDDDRLIWDASESEVYEYVGKCVPTVTSTIQSGSMPTTDSYYVATVSSASRASTGTGTQTRASSTSTTTTPPPQQTSSTQGGGQQQQTSSSSANGDQSQATSSNLQTFTGAYLGILAPAVTGPDASGVFHVDTDQNKFNNKLSAIARSCDIQKNNCANEANKEGVAVSGCDTQNTQCKSETGSTNA